LKQTKSQSNIQDDSDLTLKNLYISASMSTVTDRNVRATLTTAEIT